MPKPVLSLEAFADWCEKQGDREYDYYESRVCAVAQYANFVGLDELYHAEQMNFSSQHFFVAMSDGPACTRPWTFSALAARLRSAS